MLNKKCGYCKSEWLKVLEWIRQCENKTNPHASPSELSLLKAFVSRRF